jgi:hypothetical protein
MKFFVELEKSKIFEAIIYILFYSTSVAGIIFLFTGYYYITITIFLLWLWFIVLPYYILFEKRNMKHAFIDFLNILDTPIDDLKHSLNGKKIFGYTVSFPKWLMKGSGNPNK